MLYSLISRYLKVRYYVKIWYGPQGIVLMLIKWYQCVNVVFFNTNKNLFWKISLKILDWPNMTLVSYYILLIIMNYLIIILENLYCK